MSEELLKRITDYIVKTVQEESILSGFQYVVDYSDVQSHFAKEIGEYINNQIVEALEDREEVADVQLDTDGFDVVLYTNFAPNYEGEEDEE